MNLTFKLKPTKYVAPTKDILMRKMSMTGYSMSSQYGLSFYGDYAGHKNSFMFVYTSQKFKPKFKQTKDKDNNTKSVKVRDGHWVGHVYRIPKEFLDAAGLKAMQENRTFRLVKRK